MKQIVYAFAAALMLASCSGSKYKIAVTFPDDSFNGKMAYLTSYDTGDTIDSAQVANKSLVLEGNVDQSYYSRLIVDGNRLGFIVEGGDISILWKDGKATGTPLNEKLNKIDDRLGEFDNEFNKISDQFKSNKITEAEADKMGNAVNDKMTQFFHQTYEDNRDNAIGPWAFNYYIMQNNFTTAQLDSLIKTAPASYAQLKRFKKAKSDAHQKELTAVGKQFTDFEIVTESGAKTHLSDYVGKGKYTVVDFWASWCGPCRHEIQGALMQIYKKYNGKLNVVGVAVWDDPADTHAAIAELQIPWPVMIGNHKLDQPTDLYGISGIPHIMIVDPKGKIVSRGLQGDALVAEVDRLMK